MKIRPNSPSNRPQPPAAAPSQPTGLPTLDDIFQGSKPKFGRVYDKFIAGSQVPHPMAGPEYYDQAADQARAAVYYGDVAKLSDPAERTAKLRDLVTSSHHPEPKGYNFVVARSLYSDVDRHPDGTVRSVYNQEPVQVLTYPDVSLQTLTEKDVNTIAGASTVGPEVMGAWLAFQKGAANLNCEHVVPQSFFDKKEPMRSDLHHLYACNMKENNERGDTPYGKFTPAGGKGEVARATLYFMLRYPQVHTPYTKQDVEMFKQWSQADPPDLHERHRNQEIQKLQGNRNPFIDHPEWVGDFSPK